MFSLVGKTFLDNYNKQIIKSIKKSYTLEKDKVIKKKIVVSLLKNII